MAKKRKAESDQSTTLHDFFNANQTSSKPSRTGNPVSKRPRPLESSSSNSRGSGNTLERNGTNKTNGSVNEVIEILDSDEEKAVSRKAGPCIVLDDEDDEELPPTNEESQALMEEPSINEFQTLDYSTFFLRSPSPGHEGPMAVATFPNWPKDGVINQDLTHIDDAEDIKRRLERLSPDEWEMGDDEGFSESASTGQSEPEDELKDEDEEEKREDNEQAFEEEMEIEHAELEVIDLSDDDEEKSINELICPICKLDLGSLDAESSSSHVNKCLDKLLTNRSSKAGTSAQKQAKSLQPISSLPIPPHPDSQLHVPASEDEKPNKALNAFSFLMSRNQENEAWKEATEAEKSKWGKMNKGKGKVKKEVKEEIEEIGDDDELLETKPRGIKDENENARRAAPFYKVMQGMPVAVDAFRYGRIPGVTAYFLTHAHSDHYTNLSASWKHGPIYCSETTANLIIHMLNVDPKWVHSLPMDTETELPNTGGVKVTLIEANHCPGSCLFFFEGKQTVNAGDSKVHSKFVGTARIFRYLHCGDFRACPQHVAHPVVKGKKLDLIYLDTTYLDPKYCFPPQRMVIDACAELATRIVRNGGDQNLDTPSSSSIKDFVKGWLGGEKSVKAETASSTCSVLVVVGTYTIGKERIVKAIAKALNTLIWCDPRKRAFFECQASLDPELQTMIGDDPLKCGVHVRPLQDITSDRLLEYLELWKGQWTKVVGMRPTGWTYTPPTGTDTSNLYNIIQRDQKRMYNWSYLKPMRNSTPTVMLYGVPYSEHSSFFELTCFALSISYVRMIATVNVGSAKSRSKMSGWFEKWEWEKKRREKEAGDKGVLVPRHAEYW